MTEANRALGWFFIMPARDRGPADLDLADKLFALIMGKNGCESP